MGPRKVWVAGTFAMVAVALVGCGSGKTVCTQGGRGYGAGEMFPAGDGCNHCTCGSDGQIACTLIGCPPPGCTFDRTYRYGSDGGLVAYRDEVTLVFQSYQYQRRTSAGGDAGASCTPAFPVCDDPGAIDVRDVMQRLMDPAVQWALSQATPPVYGRDTRPADGQIFGLMRDDGHGFFAGQPCVAGTECTAIPDGIALLVETLRALDQQQLADPSCAALR